MIARRSLLGAPAVFVTKKSAAVKAQLDAEAAAATASAKVQALQAAAKALLGPDFPIYPECSL